MSREYKNILHLTDSPYGNEENRKLTLDELRNSSPLPKAVVYEDIDKEMHRWAEEELGISFEGEKLPLMDLFSNQRFSEYMQSWKFVDSDKNLILNFKTLSRENNPKSGTINGETKNIPGDRTYLMKRVEAYDSANRKYYVDYRMKQPFSIDLNYTISIMTNRYELINKFNVLVNDKFKAITQYIKPNGHFMAMNLEDISDESEYSIDDRQFYSQSYRILVKAYIITEDSFQVVEVPSVKFVGFEGDKKAAIVTIEDAVCDEPVNPYDYIPIILTVKLNDSCTKTKFILDCNFNVETVEYEQSAISMVRIFENDTEITEKENFQLHKDSEIKICAKFKCWYSGEQNIVLRGWDMDETYEKIDEVVKEDTVEC